MVNASVPSGRAKSWKSQKAVTSCSWPVGPPYWLIDHRRECFSALNCPETQPFWYATRAKSFDRSHVYRILYFQFVSECRIERLSVSTHRRQYGGHLSRKCKCHFCTRYMQNLPIITSFEGNLALSSERKNRKVSFWSSSTPTWRTPEITIEYSSSIVSSRDAYESSEIIAIFTESRVFHLSVAAETRKYFLLLHRTCVRQYGGQRPKPSTPRNVNRFCVAQNFFNPNDTRGTIIFAEEGKYFLVPQLWY